MRGVDIASISAEGFYISVTKVVSEDEYDIWAFIGCCLWWVEEASDCKDGAKEGWFMVAHSMIPKGHRVSRRRHVFFKNAVV